MSALEEDPRFDWMYEKEDTSWLDAPETSELAWLLDDAAAPVPRGVRLARSRDPGFKSLAVATRALPYRQKMFLKCMLANQMEPGRARKAMKAADVPVDHHTTARWMQDGEFKKVLDRYADLALSASGASSPASILTRIDHVVEDAMTPVAKFHKDRQLRYEDGSPVMEVDRSNALKGLDLLAKARGLLKNDEESKGRVTVVLDFSGGVPQGEQATEEGGRDEAIDAEFTEVPK